MDKTYVVKEIKSPTDYELNDSCTKQNFSTTGISNSLPKNTKNTKIRFYVEWIDDVLM